MTTPIPYRWAHIAEIRDRAALELVSRLVQSELIVMEAQVAQLQSISKAIDQRVKGLGKD